MAGVTRETISRKLNKFESLGLMASVGNKKIIIKNQLAIRRLISF